MVVGGDVVNGGCLRCGTGDAAPSRLRCGTSREDMYWDIGAVCAIRCRVRGDGGA